MDEEENRKSFYDNLAEIKSQISVLNDSLDQLNSNINKEMPERLIRLREDFTFTEETFGSLNETVKGFEKEIEMSRKKLYYSDASRLVSLVVFFLFLYAVLDRVLEYCDQGNPNHHYEKICLDNLNECKEDKPGDKPSCVINYSTCLRDSR